jgi:hypothetical protein
VDENNLIFDANIRPPSSFGNSKPFVEGEPY